MFNFENDVIIVTGAAQGMGKGVSFALANLGATVCMLDKSDSIRNSAKELNDEGYKVYDYVCDVTDSKSVKDTFKMIEKQHGIIHKLVNVAGISASVDFTSDEIDAIKDKIMDVNFNGIWNTCRNVIPCMIKNGGGSIVNFSSVTGNIVSDPGMSAYAASKGAVSALTRSLAIEFADRNININAILPGYVWTDMLKKYNPEDPDEVKERFSKGIPMKRLGSVEEAGSIVAFLLSEGAKYITGHNLVFDGGTTLVETKELIVKGKKNL